MKMVAKALEIMITDEECHLSQEPTARKWKSTQITANIRPFYFTNKNSWFLSLQAIPPPLQSAFLISVNGMKPTHYQQSWELLWIVISTKGLPSLTPVLLLSTNTRKLNSHKVKRPKGACHQACSHGSSGAAFSPSLESASLSAAVPFPAGREGTARVPGFRPTHSHPGEGVLRSPRWMSVLMHWKNWSTVPGSPGTTLQTSWCLDSWRSRWRFPTLGLQVGPVSLERTGWVAEEEITWRNM